MKIEVKCWSRGSLIARIQCNKGSTGRNEIKVNEILGLNVVHGLRKATQDRGHRYRLLLNMFVEKYSK